jgi:uncharacterized protein YxjI
MDKLAALDTLVIQQRKEWGEILTGWETKNKYAVLDGAGDEVYFAAEEGRSLFFRVFLKALRPFTIHILDAEGQPILRLDRPFRFYFHTLEVCSPDGRRLGTVERRFSVVRRVYSVYDDTGQERFQLFGPLLRPWTFLIRARGEEIGRIAKKWTGVLKESLSDADNFAMSFPAELQLNHKGVLLGAVFLIDFVHFES